MSNEKPIFSATLRPHRSLGPVGFGLVIGLITVTCVGSGILFMLAGAWPVLIFCLVDAALVWVAFKVNFRAALAYEEVSLWRHALVVRKHAPGGQIITHTANPFWTRFQVDRHEAAGVTAMHLSGPDFGISIGGFLNPPDRETFAAAFATALARAKGT